MNLSKSISTKIMCWVWEGLARLDHCVLQQVYFALLKDPALLKNKSVHKFVIRVVHVFHVHLALYLSV